VSPQATRRHQTPTVRAAADESTASNEPHGVDVTHVPPGTIERMATSGAVPSPEFRAAIDRARERRNPQPAAHIVAMLDWPAIWCYTGRIEKDPAELRQELADANADGPAGKWRIYALTDITERPTNE
jgi:hypothetical protein